MSKSLGNSPDALKLIKDYSADGVRVGLLLSSAAGNDLMFDEALCQQGKSFGNKIWNAFRLINGWEVVDQEQPGYASRAIQWYESKFQKALEEIEDHFSKYRLSDALMVTYKLVWDDFCSWFLEVVKPAYGKPIDSKTFEAVQKLLESNLKILHPFMPFLTEEIWHHIKKRDVSGALIVSHWPKSTSYDTDVLNNFDFTTEVISGIRNIRKQKQIAFKQPIELFVMNNESQPTNLDTIITKLGNISDLKYTSDTVENALTFRVKSNEYFIPAGDAIDVEAEIKKLTEELNYTEGFLKSVQKKLSNERFVSGAPEQVVASERKKESDAIAKIETLKSSLESLK
jgi:valyl-tRNA synthetase